jgi:hypothetical protein
VRDVDRRLHLRLRITAEIAGLDANGQGFVELASTIVVAPSGAIVEMAASLDPDQEISVRMGKHESLARVLGQVGIGDSKYHYGIAFIQPDAAFWGVHFPKIATGSGHAGTAMIVCGRCSTQRTYVLNEIETLVLSTSHSFGLFCPTCKDATLWKLGTESDFASGEAQEQQKLAGRDMYEWIPPSPDLQEDVVSLASAIETQGAGAPRKNERKHPRVSMSRGRACVQRPDADEEIVDLVNVSRGGASFRSGKVYPLGCWIRIAAPCTVGAANIFALGRVVRAVRAEYGREYGVEYVETHA